MSYRRQVAGHPEILWRLELAVETMPLSRLEWHLDEKLWPLDDQPEVLTPRQVVISPHRYAAAWQRVQAADLIFPLDITRHAGRWLILDGARRLLRAHERSHPSIKVRKVPDLALATLGILP